MRHTCPALSAVAAPGPGLHASLRGTTQPMGVYANRLSFAGELFLEGLSFIQITSSCNFDVNILGRADATGNGALGVTYPGQDFFDSCAVRNHLN